MNTSNKNKRTLPLDGIDGLKQNYRSDALSGFLVFLLALPLSLGIAGASDFPPVYGLITAMIGGVVVSFMVGSPLTIKGPAAGLIVIVAGAVAELGKGDNELGWKLALGAIVVAGLIQIVFGLLKFGSYTDFFPLSAVHGMLAAIGIIIISKQVHILVGMNPLTHEGKPMVEPLELLLEIKNTLSHFLLHIDVDFVGLVSLAIVFGWAKIPFKIFKKIPSALVVLLVTVPLGMAVGLNNSDPDFQPLLSFKKGLLDIVGVNVSFDGFSQMGTFIKFVVMFALVGSLESLLTVKAIDMLDPYLRRSNPNKDLIAVGIGNTVAGILGGLPMISEVARSSANVRNGAQTRWANFFHGFFIFIFLLFAVNFSDLIPKSALAAMLIGVGWKLAHPREFGLMAKIGKDQLAVFLTTIVFTLTTDLLIGIGTGILLEFILHISRGVPLKNIFNNKMERNQNTIKVHGAAIFSNFVKVKKELLSIPLTEKVVLDVRDCVLVDHSVRETLHHMKDDFTTEGGDLDILGIEEFRPTGKSKHPLSSVVKINK